MINFSIIIPQYNSLDTVPRLLDSIPIREDIEILVIDNSPIPISKNDINVNREYKLLHCPSSLYAGGARNVGIQNAKGKWLIFADSDDFFLENAFTIFDKYINSEFDLIYFKANSVDSETLLPSTRGEMWSRIIDQYKEGELSAIQARLYFLVPWAKMIKMELIKQHNIFFDEIIAANDVMFSTKCGFYARTFNVDDKIVYCVTHRRGSLANRQDLPVIKSRFIVALERNLFLRKNNLAYLQGSVMIYIFKSIKFGFIVFIKFLLISLKYKQNIFIGYKNWFKTYHTSIKSKK